MCDSSCLMKPADKGSAIVTPDKDNYLRECNNHQEDMSIFEKAKGDPVIKKKIFTALDLIRMGLFGAVYGCRDGEAGGGGEDCGCSKVSLT